VQGELGPLLRAHGVETWEAEVDIRTADEWEARIRTGLELCDWFLVVLSPNAVNSDWVKTEVHWAMENRNGRVIPLVIAPCKSEDLHLKLRRIQHIDFEQNRERFGTMLLELVKIGNDALPTVREILADDDVKQHDRAIANLEKAGTPAAVFLADALANKRVECQSATDPQPTKEAARGVPSAKCALCGTFNLLYFEQGQHCRGCEHPLEDACAVEYLEWVKDRIFANAANMGLLAGGLTFVVIFWVLVCIIPAVSLQFLVTVAIIVGHVTVAGLIGAATSYIVVSKRYVFWFSSPSDALEKIKQKNKFHDDFINGWQGASDRFWISHTKLAWITSTVGLFLLGVVLMQFWGCNAIRGPSPIVGIEPEWDPNPANHDLLLTNKSSGPLSSVELTITLYQDNGQEVVRKESWPHWDFGEVKKISVPLQRYSRVTLKGTADHASTRRVIDGDWRWTPK
jgi:hypothetical protein